MGVQAEVEPRWRRRPAERPEEILDAALGVFAEQGLAGARVEDIAARAGVSKGTLYRYFTGKDEIFQEAVRALVARNVRELTAATAPGDPVGRLDRCITVWWGVLRRPSFGALYRLILAELHHFPDLVRFYAEEVSGQVSTVAAQIIRDGVAGGTFRRVEPPVAARMLHGLLTQHAVWAARRDLFSHLGARSDEDLVREVREFVFSALLAPGATGGEA